MELAFAGGVESISQIRTRSATDSGDSGMDPWLVEHKPALYMAMIETADIVFAEFARLVRDEGSAALVATHNERLAARMDRVVRLHEGQLA